jgi:phosphomannomutase
MKSDRSKKSSKSIQKSSGKSRKITKKAAKGASAKAEISPEVRAKSAILDWCGPAFPLEVREEAALVFADYTRKGGSETADFYMHPLQFGTGGLRGVIGNGAGRMNPWTVGRTTVGLCNYLKSRNKKASLVIAHDSRRMSPEFAQTTAGIAASLGLKVYLFDGVTPTPVLSYAIRKLKASGGVVITASHNPPEYNGYKVYIDDGSQLVGDAQVRLEEAIAAVSGWDGIPFLFEKDPVYKRNVKKVGAEIKKSYYAEFKRVDFVSPAKQNKAKAKLKIIYSPLHGTGGPWLPGLLKQYGFQVEMVPEQEKPDGEFPTVKYPNPEEPEALKLSEELARVRGADIFLATDPDADRLGAGVRNAAGGYTLINGNQIGSIMCAHLCEKVAEARQSDGAKGGDGIKTQKKKGKPQKEPRYHVLKTIVTTDLQKEIAEANGIEVRDVLTGFKYIAEQMKLMEKGDRSAGFQKGRDEYLFGGEESFGYLPVEFVRDKDALASALLLCEVLAERGDLLNYLNQIYLKYGLYLEDLKSITLKGSAGQARIQEIINGLREQNLIGWKLGDRTVTGVLDYKNQTRDGKKDSKVFGLLPPANVVQLLLEPEGKLTIRPSGTEPKVKLYASLHSKTTPSSLDELQLAMDELQNELASISGHFFARTGLA